MDPGGARIEKKKTVKRQIRDTQRLLSRVCNNSYNLMYCRPFTHLAIMIGRSPRDCKTNKGTDVEITPARAY